MKNFGDITEENKGDFAKLKAEEQEILERQKQLEKSTDDLADKYEHLSSKMADMS
jgi:predicted  nucleic acid-binding Zn-ribbon protein